MLSDPELTNAKRFMAFVDFEKIPLHSVAILDAERRPICATRGPEPFMDVDFVRNRPRGRSRSVALTS